MLGYVEHINYFVTNTCTT